ncbi:MAG: hypothetical protein JWQ66_3520, partial [Mucilaginibacter sp.]|nr:hypothetical protein [Mucilaginibacter sp.]
MTIFYFLAAFLLVNRLKKALKFSILYPKWRTAISAASWSVIALYIASFSIDDFAANAIGAFILLGLLYYIHIQPDFQSQKPYLVANLPLIAMGFINTLVQLILPDFYEKYDNYFQWATIAAFVWIFGRWATSRKQEEELRISTERRAELEALVQERTVELSKQKNELQEIVKELKSTQNQLIQSEKMASLGELT